MQDVETVLGVLRERGRRGLPCNELYRQLFNPQLYLLAYGRLYSNHGAMTPGVDGETVDGMSLGKIGRIIEALRHERYRFQPVKRTYIPKKDGKRRPLGIPSWSDKLVGEVLRLLLEAYYEPRFSSRSHGFRPSRGGTNKRYVYTWPTKKALASILDKARQLTRRRRHRTLADLLRHLNPVLRGWCNYFKHGVSKRTFGYVDHYTWGRVVTWMRKRHHGLSWGTFCRRFLPQWQIRDGKTAMFRPQKVEVSRYRYRGTQIPTPWAARPTETVAAMA
jgi:hypothetical protein